MSAIYNLEPQPTASAIIHTTLGEISVELFAKQTPLTCRNFLQLALDGYYDGTIFHRLVPGFILQGGDPTGTGNGGESIYDGGAFGGDLDPWPMDMRQGRNAGPQGVNFKDEFHSRLKFNRRGLLGMANDGRPNTNGSQFFFTLDKSDELNGKNTLFGRVAGDTIYNLAKIGESEVADGTDRPLYPVKIQKIEILVNPFEGMQKRSRVAPQLHQKQPAGKGEAKKTKKRKGGKQLLSFGDEDGDEEVPVLKKAKFDTRIIAEAPEEEEKETPKPKAKKRRESPQPAPPDLDRESPQPEPEPKKVPSRLSTAGEPSPSPSPSPSPEPAPQKSALEKANEEIAALKASLRRTVHDGNPAKEEKKKKKSVLESMVPETSIKGARKRRPGANPIDDPKTLNMLKAFGSMLEKAPPEKQTELEANKEGGEDTAGAAEGGPDGEAELCDLHFIANCQSCTSWDKQAKEESDDEGWMSHALSSAADKLGKDLSNRRQAEEELVVIDPRERARTMKEEKKAERDARAEQSGRQWDQRRDQARNAQLAKTSALAGRGAR
ncbi:Peptidyl-prolyl isomerase-like protein [Hapsidospora chrysogenum ATCC 11550]|uniref:peptidylprolyl isomerase n=1 Tax=Hapsidospora chrysogenum (strain ATCC 11550 / CBS 779.69 / DSM 880 / IAM 14645 / JCM 23072 / IMI 49137) TaxID=857340 RepID=A0A086TBN6_HAPC1|nr:Peptidyl-prolyl isomerase-like protein [Hapsidospora chrysogenum ATCC 11550]